MSGDSVYISKNKQLLDVEMIHAFIERSYWGKGRTRAQVEKSIEHSICFGLFKRSEIEAKRDRQIGFARVITDQLSFAYIADVFVIESERRQGYSKVIIEAILKDENLSELRKWYLITKDAQRLYHKFGFAEYNDADKTLMHLNTTEK